MPLTQKNFVSTGQESLCGFADVYVPNHDGNLIDASAAAVAVEEY
jgi:exosome complex RNA-binding protein Rrp42 (RNase PH superfamily)